LSFKSLGYATVLFFRSGTKFSSISSFQTASYNFTDEELTELRKKSEVGDVESSRKLFSFYNFAVRDRRLKTVEWLEKAVEQGSSDAQYGLTYEFSY
jgi:TPR repeat protein